LSAPGVRARILDAVCAIPEGFVRTYGDLSPGAPRLAGWALRESAEEVPWWRVVRADGTLAVGERQRALLDSEGVPFIPGQRVRVDLRVARVPFEPAEH
jgi:alkylated DNA nucleotide flippase Atl1